MKLICCYINKKNKNCNKNARVEIWGDKDPYDYTHSCSKHIYNLMNSGVNRVYPIEERLTV